MPNLHKKLLKTLNKNKQVHKTLDKKLPLKPKPEKIKIH